MPIRTGHKHQRATPGRPQPHSDGSYTEPSVGALDFVLQAWKQPNMLANVLPLSRSYGLPSCWPIGYCCRQLSALCPTRGSGLTVMNGSREVRIRVTACSSSKDRISTGVSLSSRE